ncbi:MAG: 3-methyl-2-oxobutanoate hydroxymethyltransferase, 3-methyl-2-oxobutanoate hydroxymethyltransferase [Candidatus Peregrinibacteria bacterium GW2011_GWF2_33_10]|nr:MAG: 3-methyl-2-oxobutanoate hydroxymethyltransferase, 3-methyl-2-oxobutanoate hydroxymethyltransferase [Candidatus Peregrinibacteria bacterium GW2011_GWF2_33_10]OGJ44429.1 MAG: 3-methyl-2-oxobutanoate hydroxymethyltransferase [Candidatus Peregrinibacteria bacterium RIFOXYA2_FULL_33_21]OGJ46730.1 MAG: 3-methyl-2-oxobutanoate hydroxymethyltransferase [Candidatus Peregrinibacteria bacterium RIFOXYA12_FULL_33_12]OGJ50128.1 MAG: 3-methyl-2-oxobutanoate hydroxymethyltransferase [Candidatus Peregri
MFQETHSKLICLTAYDSKTAQLLEQAAVDMILVGDSYGMVVFGSQDTKTVTLEQMIKIGQEVRQGAPNSFVVVDMPYQTYENKRMALHNAKLILQKTKCEAIKIEGCPQIVKFLVKNGVKVIGHSGLKPQFASKFQMLGKNTEEANSIYKEALALEGAGVLAVVLECVPEDLAKKITDNLKIPTIGIGAGKFTDGQIRVTHDILAWPGGKKLKFIKQYNSPHKSDLANLQDFIRDIKRN